MKATGTVLLGCASLLAAAAASAATAPPKLTSAAVVGDRVTLTFAAALKPRVGTWTIVVNGKPVRATAATYAGPRIQLRLPVAVYSDDTVRVVARGLRSAKGARMAAVDTKPANRSTAGCSEQLGTVAEGTVSEGPTDRKTFLAPDRFHLLNVHVDFADFPSAGPAPVNLELLDRHVRDLSYGRSSVTGTTLPGLYRMPKNATTYAHVGPWGTRKTFLQDVVVRLDPEVDFSSYDAVVVTVRMQAIRGVRPPVVDAIALAPTGSGVHADGKELRHFVVTSSPLGAVAPLLYLAGLPVLDTRNVQSWDLMTRQYTADRLGLVAWHRRKLGWILPSEVRCLRDRPIDVTLAPLWRGGGVKAVIAATGSHTAVVLENRQLQGPDVGQCSRGVLPYTVQTEPPSQIRMVHYNPSGGPCGGGWSPFDIGPGQPTRVANALTFEVHSLETDGSYRLRVSR